MVPIYLASFDSEDSKDFVQVCLFIRIKAEPGLFDSAHVPAKIL